MVTTHSKKKLLDLTKINFGCCSCKSICVLSYARLPVLKGVAQILRVYYMLE